MSIKKIICNVLIILSLLMLSGCIFKQTDSNVKSNSKEVISQVKAIIGENEYIIELEDNETAKSFVNLLPREYKMNELNGNEYYVNLDTTLPTDSYNPKRINSGDVMLYGNDCLVIFYKSFDTPYSYTKIGRINNLPNIKGNKVLVKFEK